MTASERHRDLGARARNGGGLSLARHNHAFGGEGRDILEEFVFGGHHGFERRLVQPVGGRHGCQTPGQLLSRIGDDIEILGARVDFPAGVERTRSVDHLASGGRCAHSRIAGILQHAVLVEDKHIGTFDDQFGIARSIGVAVDRIGLQLNLDGGIALADRNGRVVFHAARQHSCQQEADKPDFIYHSFHTRFWI